jgi:D-arabinose 5-phosphate isomerase GutQ
MKKKALELAKDSLKIESQAISDIVNYLDFEMFRKAVKILSTCPKTITCAIGSSGIAEKKIAHSLCCIERNAQFLYRHRYV